MGTPPDTTEIGFHDNLNEIGLILFGETDDRNSDVVFQWRVGYLVYFPRDFSQCRGFRYRLHSHIDNMSMLFEQKKDDSKKMGTYFSMNSKLSLIEINNIKQVFFNSMGLK